MLDRIKHLMTFIANIRIKVLLVFFAFIVCGSATAQLSTPRLAIGTDKQSLSLHWDSFVGASGYRFYFAPYPYTGPESIQSIDMGSALSVEGELPEGSSYYVAVEAYSDLAISTLSNVEYFVLDNAHIPFNSAAGSANGLTLIAPMSSNVTYLIDDFGTV